MDLDEVDDDTESTALMFAAQAVCMGGHEGMCCPGFTLCLLSCVTLVSTLNLHGAQ